MKTYTFRATRGNVHYTFDVNAKEYQNAEAIAFLMAKDHFEVVVLSPSNVTLIDTKDWN